MAAAAVPTKNQACVDACTECQQACESCAYACAEDAHMAECTRLCLDCATICAACVSLLSRGSRWSAQLCKLCRSDTRGWENGCWVGPAVGAEGKPWCAGDLAKGEADKPAEGLAGRLWR